MEHFYAFGRKKAAPDLSSLNFAHFNTKGNPGNASRTNTTRILKVSADRVIAVASMLPGVERYCVHKFASLTTMGEVISLIFTIEQYGMSIATTAMEAYLLSEGHEITTIELVGEEFYEATYGFNTCDEVSSATDGEVSRMFHAIRGIMRLCIGSSGNNQARHNEKLTKRLEAFGKVADIDLTFLSVPPILYQATDTISGMTAFRNFVFNNMASNFDAGKDEMGYSKRIVDQTMQYIEKSGMTGVYMIINILLATQHPILHSSHFSSELPAFMVAIKPLFDLGENVQYATFYLNARQRQRLQISNFRSLQNAAVAIARILQPNMKNFKMSENAIFEKIQVYATKYADALLTLPSYNEIPFTTDNDDLSNQVHEWVSKKIREDPTQDGGGYSGVPNDVVGAAPGKVHDSVNRI